MNLKRRVRDLEQQHDGRPRLLVLGREMPGTAHQFFRLVRLMQHNHDGTDPEVDFPTGLERAQIDLADIAVASASGKLDGSAAQLFGLLGALALGPAEERSEANV